MDTATKALVALTEMQPSLFGIKRHVPGRFIAIETLEQDASPDAKVGSVEGDNELGSRDGSCRSRSEGSGAAEERGRSSGRVGGGSGSGKLRRHPPGRTLEFACGNLFDVEDISQVMGKKGLRDVIGWGVHSSLPR